MESSSLLFIEYVQDFPEDFTGGGGVGLKDLGEQPRGRGLRVNKVRKLF